MINSILSLDAVYEEDTLQIWNRNKLPILKELKATSLFEWLALPYWCTGSLCPQTNNPIGGTW